MTEERIEIVLNEVVTLPSKPKKGKEIVALPLSFWVRVHTEKGPGDRPTLNSLTSDMSPERPIPAGLSWIVRFEIALLLVYEWPEVAAPVISQSAIGSVSAISAVKGKDPSAAYSSSSRPIEDRKQDVLRDSVTIFGSGPKRKEGVVDPVLPENRLRSSSEGKDRKVAAKLAITTPIRRE